MNLERKNPFGRRQPRNERRKEGREDGGCCRRAAASTLTLYVS
jgi:hypothetical protein